MDETRRAVSYSYPPDGEPAESVDPPGGEDVLNARETKVALHLTTGGVEITVDRSATPYTISSFMSLTQQGWFDEVGYHRLIDYGIFMLQRGDPTGAGKGRPGYTIPDELSPRTTGLEKEGSAAIYPKETVVMADTGRPNTAGSQFFIVWEDSQLSPDYVVFGVVDEGGPTVVQRTAAQRVDETDGTSPMAETVISSVTLN